MVSAVSRVVVPFHAATSGVEELTWGQREIWTAMVNQQSWLPIFFVQPLEPFTTVDGVAAELRYCMQRYDSMRTRLEFGTGGEPRQVVAGAGETVLEVFEAGDADPAEVAAEVREQYRTGDHDFVHDWPARTAVVLRHGTPTHLVSVYCHLVMDALARAVMLRDLRDRGAVPGGAMRPAQLAEWERGDAARKLNTASMAYWERQLRRIPARRFAASADPRTPRYWEAVFRSRALHLALQVIAPGAAGATAPLLTVFAVALARVTGSNPVVAQVVVGNRFHSHLADVFAPVNQTGLWVLDVADTTVAEALGRSRRRAMSTYKHAYYDPRERAGLIARVSCERGEELDLNCFFNDRRMNRTTGDVPTAADVTAALGTSTFTWRTRTDKPNERLFVHAEDATDVVELSAWTDTRYLSPGDLEAVLREMEAVAVAAALDPAEPTRVHGAALVQPEHQ
ncbi:condensation domain-containing protein [Dactylosporangium sp. CA-233914]|uniref:condensation domain-containing protein n=1 Tax=Dactylosporangium sp. CA-233914 TaxID=3239934 RepID=UPI003D941949